MNPHYSSYMATIHQPAIAPRMGDLCFPAGHIMINVEPDLAAKADTDYLALAEQYGRGIMFIGLLKKK
jgi:hypothetical protein